MMKAVENKAVRFCTNCRLTNPGDARRCVCGKSLVPEWELAEEREQRQFANRRAVDLLWQLLSISALAVVLGAAYFFADRL
jgi:hypothetical protein